jgi:diguanylate cyclase (GGDEF)-like protein
MDVCQDEQLAQVLVEFAQLLGSDCFPQAIVNHLVQRAVDVLPITGAGVMIAHGQGGLRSVAARGHVVETRDSTLNELQDRPCWEVYRTGVAVSIPDLRQDRRYAGFSLRAQEQGVAAAFTFPMRLNGTCVGTVELYRDTPGPLCGWSRRAGQVLADVAAAYLHNAQSRLDASALLEQLSHRSLHDPLTGLANRALFEQLLDQAVARSRRSHHLAAVLFLDLDHFKSVNDRHGHQVGDDLLAAVAARVHAALRPGDTLARFGGDEFVALCEDLSEAQAAETIADRIGDVMAEPFLIAGRALSMTASVGIAVFGRGDDTPERLLRNADDAMYAAKGNGGAQHSLAPLRRARRPAA